MYDLISIYSNSAALAQWQSSKSSMYFVACIEGMSQELTTLVNKVYLCGDIAYDHVRAECFASRELLLIYCRSLNQSSA